MTGRGDMRNPDHPIAAKLRTTCARFRGQLISTAIHTVALLLILGVLHGASHIAPYRLPGTASGVKLITYYSPGSPANAVSDMPVKAKAEPTPAPMMHAAVAPPKPKETTTPSAETGSGSSPDSGLGEGDIKIALQTYFPYPKPSLSGLPHGTKGDVVLDAVIDEHGKITGLTLLKGLGSPIDDTVIATVKQWSYTPATRNGVP